MERKTGLGVFVMFDCRLEQNCFQPSLMNGNRPAERQDLKGR